MFKGCSKIIYLYLFNFDTSSVTSFYSMFNGCSSLYYINLTIFDTLSVLNMGYMFNGCSSLKYLSLSNFDTTKVTNMESMFSGCSSLNTLDLDNFNTSKTIDMNNMFSNCKELIKLNLSNFNTEMVINISSMFNGCQKLNSVDLSNFNTSQTTDMGSLFSNCTSLYSLDLTNFRTTSVTNMNSMFYGCCELNILNLVNFDTSKVTDFGEMFSRCSSLNSLYLSNFNISYSANISSMFNFCNQLKFIDLYNSSIYSPLTYFNEYLNYNEKVIICVSQNIILEGNNINILLDNIYIKNKEYNCYYKSLNNNLKEYISDICGNNFYEIYNDTNNNNSFINCFPNREGFYLDYNNTNLQYKPCYLTCKTCDKEGNYINHNCIECSNKYKMELNISNYLNCFNSCDNYYYKDIISNKTYCTYYKKCPEDYSKLIINKSECIDNCTRDPLYKYEFNNICYETEILDYLNNTSYISEIMSDKITDKESYNNISTEIISDNINSIIDKISTSPISIIYANSYITEYEYIREYILKDYNKNEILNGNNYEIELKNVLFSLSTIENQKNNINKNKTSIDLKNCENILKLEYNITSNDTLYILMIVVEKGMKIPKIEYEVYYPLFNEKLIKLNLTLCKNIKIDVSIPVKMTDSLDKYNQSSGYYNDFCSKITSENGVDITLKDRRNLFIEKNMSLCEEDCELKDYNYTSERVKCTCPIKISVPFLEEIKFDKNKLLKKFKDINNIANINLLKCYKKVFDGKNLKNNKGFYLYLFIMILCLVFFIIFYFKDYFNLFTDIKKIIEAKNKISELEKNINNKFITNEQEQKNNIVYNFFDQILELFYMKNSSILCHYISLFLYILNILNYFLIQ